VRRADLLICISAVFREHIHRDYGFPLEKTVVVPNPIRFERFTSPQLDRGLGEEPTVLVLGRISARKGIDDVIAVARELLSRGSRARVRVVGGPSLWSDYRPLLADLPRANSEHLDHVPPGDIAAFLVGCDLMLQAATYEPFGLTVAEGLACGLPVVATSEVGAIEGVDRAVVVETAPRDVKAMADGIERLIGELEQDAGVVRATARNEAERLFAADRVCGQISDALQALVHGVQS
jgi:glycosyltransferase involved in cell wall biosynthesis